MSTKILLSKVQETDSGSTLVISYIGYESVEVSVDGASLGEISLSPEENILSGVTVFGTVNLAKDRETPVAQSTLNASEEKDEFIC